MRTASEVKPAVSSGVLTEISMISVIMTIINGRRYPRKRAVYPIDCFMITTTLSPAETLYLPGTSIIFSSFPDIEHDPSAWQPEHAAEDMMLTVTDLSSDF